MKELVIILAGVAVVILVTLVGLIKVGNTNDPLEQLTKEYNHIKMFEDGSYTGETMDGQQVKGCIKSAICNE